ncbi:hypothetical protein ACFPOE_11130 [Caenimonas terrae]|uniref:DUF1704 domain-containing protein n=1 Tax=Caenimonas terrae TaxID=696074 RepID=A0ABW0NEU7_9BURK
MNAPQFTQQRPQAIAWDIARDAPQLHAALAAGVPALDRRLAQLRAALPCAASVAPFSGAAPDGDYVRPYRHLRAFYQQLPGGVFAFKGTEPYAADRDAHLRTLAEFRVDYPARGRSLFSAAEHFALVEQKTPLALGLDEALDDARIASALQAAHLARFGELARLPTPLLAIAWPRSTRDEHLAALRPLLSQRALRIVETCTQSGLGALVYHYPSVPIRVAHLPVELATRGDEPWLQRLAKRTDPALAVERWIDLVARLLALGWLPGRTDHIGIGHCVEMQNAVIDGGFVDVGSVIAMGQVAGERAFQEMLLAAMADLSKTIRHFILGPAPDAEAEYRNPSLAMLQTLHRVLPALAERVALHQPADPRLLRALARRAPFDALAEELTLLTPGAPSMRQHT